MPQSGWESTVANPVLPLSMMLMKSNFPLFSKNFFIWKFWGFIYIYIHTHTYLFLDVKNIRGIQGRDTSVCLTHHPVSFHPPVSVWPWKGPTFQPGASQQLTNLFPQKNEAALGNCAHWERKIAPQAITNAMWAWGCWNWSLHSDPASKQRALPANSGEAACHSYCQRFPGQYLLIENC